MLNVEDYKRFLKDGTMVKELNVGGVVYKVRLLNMQDVLVSDAVTDYLTGNARSWTSPLNISFETLARLVFIVEEIDGEVLKPEISEKAKEEFLEKMLDPEAAEDAKKDFVAKYVKPRLKKLLNLPPVVIETLVEEYRKLREELRNFVEGEGGLPNS